MRRRDVHASVTSSARHRSEAGATLVEMAIVAILFFVVVFAMTEYGLLFRDNLTATDAVADAARIGGVVGPAVSELGGNADFEIVKAVRDGLASMNDEDIDYVVVFRANGSSNPAEDQLPLSCKNGNPVNGICNVYPTASAFRAAQQGTASYFDCPPSNVGPSCAWDPATRSDGSDGRPIDNLGVYVRIDRDGYTGLFGNDWTITRAQTTRLEPGTRG
ncbi:TadE/TadG family type IV pilus assembly protein [Actinospongicola halichondriae]|uniref:TadE/TadG family type IV pilus assembly protein n=1 Tax=Actinospongicola halichondriae TaxID=3236844 RepID=UPI003D5313D1